MADTIKIGNLDISAFKVGSDDCKVYLGDTLLYPTAPPVFEGKYKLTLSDSSTVSAECDGTSAVTSGEVASQYSGSVVSAEIGDCVTSLSNRTFYNCISLTSIDIPNSVTSIGNNTFENCSGLTSITIPDSVTSIGTSAFRRCTSLTSIDIPSGATSIGDNTFENCSSLTSIVIPSGVTSIGQRAFSGCTSLSSCTIGNGVTSIGAGAFNGCSGLTSVDIPSGATSIGDNTFENCSGLASIDIPSGVTSIGTSAFRRCTSLTSIDIPSGVTSIGGTAFYGCSSLTSITVNATTPPTLSGGAFNSTNNCPIYVPSASVETYKSASGWSTYARRIQAIPTPTLQWVTFSNGDTIPSDLQIYGIKGIVNDLSIPFDNNYQSIFVENAGRNKYNVFIGGYQQPCYSEYNIISNTSVEYIFSNIGCSDSYTVSSKTIADMSNDIQLYIYA